MNKPLNLLLFLKDDFDFDYNFKFLKSYNNKPVIVEVLFNFIKKGFTEFNIICSSSSQIILKSIIKKTFCNKLDFSFGFYNSIENDLFRSLKRYSQLFNFNTYLLTDLKNFDVPTFSHDFCCKIKNEQLFFYHFSKSFSVKKFLKHCNNFATFIKEYRKINNMDLLSLKKQNESVSGRYFNNFKLDKSILTKFSKDKKLANEIKWFKTIPLKISYLYPQFYGIAKQKYSYKIEYLNQKTLSEYFCFLNTTKNDFCKIFETVLSETNKIWQSENVPKNFDIVKNSRYMYQEKTLSRIMEWDRKDILNFETLTINGKKYKGFYQTFDACKQKIENLINSSKDYAGVIHGDLSFGNILYSPKTNSVKLIDPRGNFGETGIFGDVRYEIAKLRHNYHGGFDFIVNDLFDLKVENNNFNFSFYGKQLEDFKIYDKKLPKNFDIDEINLIEGLLFLSMIPLHSDNKDRQIMFFIMGILCLNKEH